MLEVVIGRGSPDAPRLALWAALPALALMAVPLFARRRFPFAGPAAYWVAGAALSFVDGRLTPYPKSVFVLGMAVSFLLGNLRDPLLARIGLAFALAGPAVVVSNLPARAAE